MTTHGLSLAATSLDAVKRKLTEAEALETAAGSSLPHTLHPSSFVRMGLEIEDQQCEFWPLSHARPLIVCRHQIIEHLRTNRQRTDPQKIEIQQRRNLLARRINIWRVAQAVYMPQASAYLPDENSPLLDDVQRPDNSKPETWPLLLPSAIPEDNRSPCYKGVIETERVLRLAQMQDNLVDLRRSRQALRNLRLYFKTNLAGEGQKTQTKTRAVETGVHSRINRAVRRYRIAYDALLELDPSGGWTREFRELRNEDNRGPLKEVDEMGTGDGQFAPSWIWTVPSAAALPGEGSDAEQQEVNETARHEWMTCRARADRWVEEKELLQEEMRRVVVYLEWKSRSWSEKVGSRVGLCTPDIQHGADSYARKQAHVHREITTLFAGQWLPYLNARGLDITWATVFPWASQVLSCKAKLPKWFPEPSQGTLHGLPPPVGPSPGAIEGLRMPEQHLGTQTTRSEDDSCEGEGQRDESFNDNDEDAGSEGYDDGEGYSSEDCDDGDYHEQDDDESARTDEFGYEYDDDYMS